MTVPHLKLLEIVQDEATGEFENTIEFKVMNSDKAKTITIDRARFGDQKTLHQQLRKAGATLDAHMGHAAPHLEKLIASESSSKLAVKTRAAKSGWHESGAFIFGDSVITTDNTLALLPPKSSGLKRAWKLSSAGTLRGWQKSISPTKKSSTMTFAAAVAFAATTLKLVNMMPFAFLLHGQTKRGKTTATLVCASAIGISSEGSLPTFDATPAAMSELTVAFNDLPLPLDELGSSSVKGVELARFLDSFAYKLGSGSTRSYSSAAINSGVVSLPERGHTLVFATSEISARDIAAAANVNRAKGATIRLCDLTFEQEGSDDIFDLCSKTSGRNARSRVRCDKIRAGIGKNHGVALARFITAIQKDPETAKNRLTTRRKSFEETLTSGDMAPEVLHLAGNFAHVYAAGSLAIDFGILPYTKKHLKRAVRLCFQRSAGRVASEANLVRDGRKKIQEAYFSGEFAIVSEHDKPKHLKNAGGFIDCSSEQPRLVLRAEKLRELLPEYRQASLVLASYAAEGRLPTVSGVPTSLPDSIQWAASQPKWPGTGEERIRSIVILTNKP